MRSYNNISTLYVSAVADVSYNGLAPEPDGKGNGPLNSVEAALYFISELRRSGVMQPICVMLREGIYSLKAPINIGPELGIVTLTAYGNEKPVISGGTKLENVKDDIFCNVKCLSAEVPSGAKFSDLYVNGLRAELPRYPENGEIPVIGAENTSGELFAHSKWFEIDTSLTGELSCDEIKNSLVTVLHYWVDEHSEIEDYDEVSGRITMKVPSRFNMLNNTGCYFENVKSCFGKVNSWYYDREESKVYYVPRNGVTAENAEIYYPRLEKLFNIEGSEESRVRNFTLRGLTLAHTKGDYISRNGTLGEASEEVYASDSQAVSNAHGAVNFTYAENCAAENCFMTELGVHAFNIFNGCSYIRITGNRIYDCGAGGVKINGSTSYQPESGRTHSCTVSDNTILHCGRRHMASCGILMMNTYCNTVSHNEIGDIYYTGISAGWVWGYTDSVSRDNIIEKNHIHDLGQGVLSDMGGVYLLGAQPGTVVRGNFIHHVKSRKYGGWALYTDEGSGYVTLENNICCFTSDNSYHQHYGRMNVVRNNIFAFSEKHLCNVTRFEGHLSIIFENNILLSKGQPIYKLKQNCVTLGTVGSGRNLFWDVTTDKPVIYDGFDKPLDLDAIKEYGMDFDSETGDPMFADPDNMDFTLDNNSPALKLGFKRIDTHDIGPRY